MNLETKISAAFSFIGTCVVHLLGGWDGFIYVLILFMALDWFTGSLAGAKRKELSANIAFTGATKKLTILAVVALAVGLDHTMGTQGSIRMLAILFYIGTEGISILENAVDLNVPIPEKLKNMLLKLQEDDEIKEA